MNVFSRGIRNAFRNVIRTFSIIVILGLSIGLSLAMLVAHQAVGQKINAVKSSVGNTISVSPAGSRGFEGGGNPLTENQLSKISSITHVVSVEESLNDRLTSTNSNLQSAINAGTLGQRFSQNSGETFTPPAGFTSKFGSGSGSFSFTPPVTVTGTTQPDNLSASSAQGGGTFKLISGSVFSASSDQHVAIIGSDLASKNNLKVGSTFTAYSTSITVIGIFDAGNTFSNNQVIMPLATVQKLSGETNDVTSATVTVDSITNVNEVTSIIQKSLGSAADVTNAETEAQNSIAPLQNIQSVSLYSLIGAVVAGAIITLLTMIMIVRERRREIGVLKAIGASNLKVMLQFMVEAATLTILGAIVGIILGVVAGNPITHLLVTNSTTSSAITANPNGPGSFGGRTISRGFGFIRHNVNNIHAAIGYSIVLEGLAVAILIAVVSSALASLFIAKIRPAEVMRVE